jgi:hypothetical protein
MSACFSILLFVILSACLYISVLVCLSFICFSVKLSIFSVVFVFIGLSVSLFSFFFSLFPLYVCLSFSNLGLQSVRWSCKSRFLTKSSNGGNVNVCSSVDRFLSPPFLSARRFAYLSYRRVVLLSTGLWSNCHFANIVCNQLVILPTCHFLDLPMEQHALKNLSNCQNTKIAFYLEASGGQNFNLHFNVLQFFNTIVNLTHVAVQDSCLPALVPNTCCSICHWCQIINLPFCHLDNLFLCLLPILSIWNFVILPFCKLPFCQLGIL